MSIRNITQGGLLICLSVLLQLLPAAFGEIFIIATILSAVPIYIMSRSNPKAGFTAYIITGVLIYTFNSHEGMFFLFTNGLVGFSIGAFSYITKSKIIISILSGVILTFSLAIVNFLIGIPVLGVNFPGSILIQIPVLMAFSIVYCFMYSLFADFTYNYLNRRYPFR